MLSQGRMLLLQGESAAWSPGLPPSLWASFLTLIPGLVSSERVGSFSNLNQARYKQVCELPVSKISGTDQCFSQILKVRPLVK